MKSLSPELARAVKEAYEAVSPFIEKHTALVCPSCERVCCIDRHGTHEEEDLAFLMALGASPPAEPPRDDDSLPCRHLTPSGCAIPRWLRPSRCTWYFCERLLAEMPRENPREYRKFREALSRLQALRAKAALSQVESSRSG